MIGYCVCCGDCSGLLGVYGNGALCRLCWLALGSPMERIPPRAFLVASEDEAIEAYRTTRDAKKRRGARNAR